MSLLLGLRESWIKGCWPWLALSLENGILGHKSCLLVGSLELGRHSQLRIPLESELLRLDCLWLGLDALKLRRSACSEGGERSSSGRLLLLLLNRLESKLQLWCAGLHRSWLRNRRSSECRSLAGLDS